MKGEMGLSVMVVVMEGMMNSMRKEIASGCWQLALGKEEERTVCIIKKLIF